jgi:hypothetical protein
VRAITFRHRFHNGQGWSVNFPMLDTGDPAADMASIAYDALHLFHVDAARFHLEDGRRITVSREGACLSDDREPVRRMIYFMPSRSAA